MEEKYNASVNASVNGTFGVPEGDYQKSFIAGYCVLFAIAAIGNVTVFISLISPRRRKSRISLMIRHLAIADLIVTFIMIPIEIGWRVTSRWVAGNVACKVFQYLRAFGPYLSSNVLVCVSLDRYYAVLHPLKLNDARRRGKVMLAWAWGTASVYCIPQLFVFRVRKHPFIEDYEQCVSFGFFTSKSQEIAYNLTCVMCLYIVPFFIMSIAYTAILIEISRSSQDTEEKPPNGRLRLRRSDTSKIAKARYRTLKMTVAIVVAYVACCTPYVGITLWYMLDWNGASGVSNWIQDGCFMMIVANSCVNPLLYGSFMISKKNICCGKCSKKSGSQLTLNNGEPQLAAGQEDYYSFSFIKYILCFCKVGTDKATKSTEIAHAVNGGIKSSRRPNNPNHNFDPLLRKRSTLRSPASADRISFLSEPHGGRRCRTSFHSEPARTYYYNDDHSQEASSYSHELSTHSQEPSTGSRSGDYSSTAPL